nr:hypothetical protein [Prevotella sp.]
MPTDFIVLSWIILPTRAGYLLWFRDRKEAHPRAASRPIGTKKGLSTLPMDRPFEVLLLEV